MHIPSFVSPSSKETEVHILIGCADARDVGQVHIDAVTHAQQTWFDKGISTVFVAVRTPGSFATPDIVADVRRVVGDAQRSTYADRPIRYYVHLQTHGEITVTSKDPYRPSFHEMGVVAGSPYNCGFLKGTDVAIEMERILLDEKPAVQLTGGRVVLDSEQAIRRLLGERYAHPGYFAGDWIRGIDDLRTHARLQKAVLETAIARDPALSGLGVHVTANIQDYQRHVTLRVDGGAPEADFWDAINTSLAAKVRALDEDAKQFMAQAQKQEPLIGLLTMADIRGSRMFAAVEYGRRKGKDVAFAPNMVFTLAGISFDAVSSPLGPYALAGFWYGAAHLKLKDWVVMGRTAEQTARMMRKVHADELLQLFARRAGVTFIPAASDDVKV